jgi:hypothetical protein
MRLLTAICLTVVLAGNVFAFERTPWQNPVIVENGTATRIDVGDAPSGLSLRRRLDPAQRYELKVSGSGGPFTMRLTRDGQAPEYLAAPVSETRKIITGTGDIELLFYADKKASYSLDAISLEPCPACRTAEDVKARIRSEIPGIDGMDVFEKAVHLLDWAANVSDHSPDPALTPKDFETWSPEQALFDFFDKDIGGVSCGGMAVFLNKIYHLFDIDSFTLNYGIPNTYLTHVTTLLRSGDKFYLYDPTFNGFYEKNGAPLDVLSAIDMHVSGRTEGLAFLSAPLPRRDFIRPGSVLEPLVCAEQYVTAAQEKRCRMGIVTYADVFARSHGQLWRSFDVPVGERTLLQLFTKGVFSVGEGLNPETRGLFVSRLKAAGVPFH